MMSSETGERIEHVIEGHELFTPSVIEILQKTYACAVGVLGGAYIDLPHGQYIKTDKAGDESSVPVAGIVFGVDLTKAPPKLVELVFELLEITQYPPEAVAAIKKILDAQQPKKAAVTFLSEV
jgi:hypothetical protein